MVTSASPGDAPMARGVSSIRAKKSTDFACCLARRRHLLVPCPSQVRAIAPGVVAAVGSLRILLVQPAREIVEFEIDCERSIDFPGGRTIFGILR
jgi:hypothetical protein